MLTAIALLPKEANAIRKSSRHKSQIKKHIERPPTRRCAVPNATSVWSICILKDSPSTRFSRSRLPGVPSNVFRILNEANVELDLATPERAARPKEKKGRE